MIKQLVKKGLATSLGWRLTAPLRRSGVIVLMYHRINAGTEHFPGMPIAQFREQMQWIKKNCSPIWPEEIADACQLASRIRPPVVITFDDGYRDYYDSAYPILRELKIPAAMFLTTDYIDRGGLIWTEALYWATMSSKKTNVTLPWQPDRLIALNNKEQRLKFVFECKAFLKRSMDIDRRRWLAKLLASLDVSEPECEIGRQMLSWDEVRACLEGTRFGGHSHTHPIMSQLQPHEVELEVQICRNRIREETGRSPECFAYPNGRANDFNENTKEILQRSGFKMAFSTMEGINGVNADSFALRRQPSGASSIGNFAALIAQAGMSKYR